MSKGSPASPLTEPPSGYRHRLAGAVGMFCVSNNVSLVARNLRTVARLVVTRRETDHSRNDARRRLPRLSWSVMSRRGDRGKVDWPVLTHRTKGSHMAKRRTCFRSADGDNMPPAPYGALVQPYVLFPVLGP